MRTDVIVGRITKAIFQHRIPPGAKLNERDLGAAFGTSRTVIRQVLIRMQESGLVVIEPHRGAFVVKPTLEEAHQIAEAQTLIEKALIGAVIDKATASDIQALRRHTALEKEAHESGDREMADDLGVAFHIRLSRILGNPFLKQIHEELMSQQRVISGVFRTEFDYCQLRDEHDALIDAIEAKSIRKAHKLIESHYRLLVKGHVNPKSEKLEIDRKALFNDVARAVPRHG